VAIKSRSDPVQRSRDVESQQVVPIEASADDSVSTYFATWMACQSVLTALGGSRFRGPGCAKKFDLALISLLLQAS